MIKLPRHLPACILLACWLIQAGDACSQKPVVAGEPGYMTVAGGAYSCLDLWATTGFVNLQVQPAWKLWVFRPQAGAMASFTGAFMVYGGLVWPAMPLKWLVIQTGAAAGYYESGSGVDLSYPLEFRLSLSVLYQFRNGMRLGAEAMHISNANLGPPNPGTESAGIIFQFPVERRK